MVAAMFMYPSRDDPRQNKRPAGLSMNAIVDRVETRVAQIQTKFGKFSGKANH